ncbi:hypothetical protein GCM10010913_27100 [Paenibacillus aceti]|uniref:Uncharacterized protein n=1 Tax=Paenibacillus aceti TaxID=1820010 RepID=A0ABQ1VZB0_9BACL|nr:hypothetical protein GCM10010913_27100 [Paenibacillus aceti]
MDIRMYKEGEMGVYYGKITSERPSAGNTRPVQLAWMGYPFKLKDVRNPPSACNLGVGFYFFL